MKKVFLLPYILLLTILLPYNLQAQLSITATSTDYIIDFDTDLSGVNKDQYSGAGFESSTSTSGQLDSEAWASTGMSDGDLGFGGSGTGGDYARGTSTGGVTTGGFYAFEVVSSDYSFGIQPGGSDWAPGTITLRIQNNTGTTITTLDITYDIYVLNNEARANSFNFSHSSDNVSYTDVSSLDFTSTAAADPTPSWVSTNRSTTVSGLSLANGSYFYIRWTGDDVSGSGSRDEFGLDNIVVNATGSATPSITVSVSSLDDFYYLVGTGPSISQSYDLSGSNLTPAIGNLTVTGTTNYEVSIDNSSFLSSVNVAYTGGSLSGTPIYVRLKSALVGGDYSGENVSNTGGGASQQDVTCNGWVSPNDLVINEILADPHPDQPPANPNGDANGDGTRDGTQDEFIEIINNEGSSINISNWTLSDAVMVRHTFPSTTIIPSGESVVIFGGGTSTNIPGTTNTASTSSLGLTNSGDVVTLKDGAGLIVGTYTYGSEGGNDESLARNPDVTGSFVGHTSIGTNPVVHSPGRDNTDNSPLPVELSSFSASIVNEGIKLNWRTETEVSNYGFEIERKTQDVRSKTWERIGFMEGHGNSNSPKEYSFIDNNVTAGKYSYRLKQIDNDGKFEYSKVIEIDVGAPLEYELSQNYPNPFNPSTTIKFSIPESGLVKLLIFNVLGEQIKTLVNGVKEAGIHTINFNATELKSGIYFYKIKTNNFTEVKKMILVQ